MNLALGLMSGTSADGITAVLTRIEGRRVEVLAEETTPYSAADRKLVLGLRNAKAAQLSEANFRIGRLFAKAVKPFLRRKIRVIGSHGQTVFHEPGRHTLQLGEPSIIAEETGIDVVADFRPRDIAAGGQGAPLVPFFDEFVFGGTKRVRALLNIGGIANVTRVGGGKRTIAFDTGPGNCLVDEAVQQLTGAEFDRDGRLAAKGDVDARLLARLVRHPYFRQRPPKSTGRERFNLAALGLRRPSIATLTYFTARTIADAITGFCGPVNEVIVSGGGAFNATLMHHLEWMLFPAAVRPSSVYAIPVMAKEGAAFALLAWEAIHGRVNTVPSATGARRAVVAGKMVPG